MLTQYPGGLSSRRRLCWGVIAVASVVLFATASAEAQLQTPIAPTSPFAGPPIPSQSAPAAPPSRANQNANANPVGEAVPSDYRLGSGDRVHITVFGQEDLTGDYQVDGSGKLAFPLIGEIQAGGLTAR